MTIVFVGIDLAKNVFAVHGVNTAGKAEMVRPNVPRAKLHEPQTTARRSLTKTATRSAARVVPRL